MSWLSVSLGMGFSHFLFSGRLHQSEYPVLFEFFVIYPQDGFF